MYIKTTFEMATVLDALWVFFNGYLFSRTSMPNRLPKALYQKCQNEVDICTWMSQEVSKWLEMGYNLLINGIY